MRTDSRDGGGTEAQTGVVNAQLLLGEAHAAAAAAAGQEFADQEFDLAERAYSDALLHLTQVRARVWVRVRVRGSG